MIHYNVIDIPKVFDFSVKGLIQKITRQVMKYEKLNGEYVVSFIFVDNQKIHKINFDYRHIDRPTDVISFANIDSSPNRVLDYELGDIYISYEKVFTQAKEYGHSPYRELAFLVTHGLLHLLGYDHLNPEDEKVMFSHQEEILNILDIKR